MRALPVHDRMTTQMEWVHLARYSKYHPDNIQRPPAQMPSREIVGPPPIATFSDAEKTLYNAWGHRLCAEAPYGQSDSRTYIKDRVAPKVGSSWAAAEQFSKGKSVSQSAMYGGGMIEPSFEQLVELRGKKG